MASNYHRKEKYSKKNYQRSTFCIYLHSRQHLLFGLFTSSIPYFLGRRHSCTASATMSTTGAGAEADMDDGFERVFNSEAFSDRVLRIEVVGRDDDEPGSSVAAASGGSCAGRKRRREEDKGDDGEGIDSSCTELGTPVLRVRTIYVSSAILAAKSSFFFKVYR
uniref:Uncharacterized protein n=2 Tax=Avena sativa TaxID=4498 RepID=A0ACD5YC44_AVESA